MNKLQAKKGYISKARMIYVAHYLDFIIRAGVITEKDIEGMTDAELVAFADKQQDRAYYDYTIFK